MLNWSIRFFICNIFIVIMVGLFLVAKQLFKRSLSNRLQYNLWFLMLALLAVPFLPLRPLGFMQIFSWFECLKSSSSYDSEVAQQIAANLNQANSMNWMNDFNISVSREAPSIIGLLLLTVWLIGILFMIILLIRTYIRLNRLKHSALPLQNKEIHVLYNRCKQEMNLHKHIPVYSTAFLKSPVMVGLFKPRIYLPIHLISDYNTNDMRYMLLHELQHYKHKDALANHLMNLVCIVYWFNPIVWYALKEMRNDREVACDTSVLQMLSENDYEDYGNTLINFAEKLSLSPFPFTSGISGNITQMKRRILNIAFYESPSFGKKIKGMIAFGMIAVLLFGLAPALYIYAAEEEYYQFNEIEKTISYIDLTSYFEGYDGSFVLYDSDYGVWEIYNKDYAAMRISPNSTYKIYDALLGLESGIITQEQSQMTWNKEDYPFEAWNADQDLYSAMQNSVNWYFQSIDAQVGMSMVKDYIQKIGYGNQNITGNLSSYWMESSLKVSPIEQVELLRKLYRNDFHFASENIQAVKDSICLSTSPEGSIYGKTGTGQVDGKNINGWFIGYIEKSGHTYFFATNIQNETNANGTAATKITLSILSDLQIWK